MKPSPPAYPTYPQVPSGQGSNNPSTHSSAPPLGVPAGFRPQSNGGWQYVNPYATMPRSHAAHYQQQATNAMPSIPEQQSVNSSSSTGRIRRSSTGEDLRAPSLTRSISTNEINYPQTSGAEQIRVRVINNNASSSSSSSGDSTNSAGARTRINSQRSILKASNDSESNTEAAPTRRIYAPSNTDIGAETMEDIFKVVNKQRTGPPRSSASPMTERVIVIDRRGSESQDDDPSGTGKNRFRTFEIQSPSSPPTPTTPQAVAPSPTPNVATLPAGYTLPQTNYYTPQQFGYQQPKMYSSVPNNLFYGATPYGGNANRFYPFAYYRY